jgi:hypothetical protein
MNAPKSSYKRVSFCSDEMLSELLDHASKVHKVNRSLFIRSVLMDFFTKELISNVEV